jgi:hypothetical protein
MRGHVISYNPFQQSRGNATPRVKVSARFEKRAAIRASIDKIDASIVQACRDQNDKAIRALAADRARLILDLKEVDRPD